MSDRIHHKPLHRAPEVVAFEVILTLGQAYLAGVCLVLAVQNGQAGLAAVVLAVLAVGAAAGYGLWLLGGPGTLMTLVNVPLLLLSLFALLVSLPPDATAIAGTIVRSDALGLVLQVIAAASAALGIAGGIFLPGPRRRRWHHAHGLDATVRPSPTPATEALGDLAERIRASLRRLKSSGSARWARRASGYEGRGPDSIPTHADLHGYEPTYQVREDDGWDHQSGEEAGTLDDSAYAQPDGPDADESDPYRSQPR